MMCNLSVIFKEDIPLCYGNALLHKQSTQTQLLLLQKIVLTKIWYIFQPVCPPSGKFLQRYTKDGRCNIERGLFLT